VIPSFDLKTLVAAVRWLEKMGPQMSALVNEIATIANDQVAAGKAHEEIDVDDMLDRAESAVSVATFGHARRDMSDARARALQAAALLMLAVHQIDDEESRRAAGGAS
jgi:hypothetical protein